jgi:hypothetical protein
VFSRALVRRRARTIVAVLCTTTGLLGLSLAAWSGLAAATPVHIYESSFGSFVNVQGIAVDEALGDVYVYDVGAGEILKYTAAGVPAEFSATKTNAITGVGGAGSGENEIAVDNSSGPARGDIYVAHGTRENVLIFSAAGQQIGELTEEAGKPWGEACGVAVDGSGNVYVGLYGSHVNEYTPTASPVTGANYAGSLSEVNSVCNIAANAAGDVYVDSWSSGPVTRYEASQFNSLEIPAVGQLLDTGGSTLAVDQSDGDVYVNEGSQVTAYDSSGALLNASAGSGDGAISGSRGIAVNEASSKVYVSDGSGSIGIFGEVDVEPPAATIDSPTGVSADQATLRGAVNPQGTEAPSDTEWHFEYSVDGGTTWESTAGEDAGVGTTPISVSAEIDLEPSEDVEARLVAANQAGTITSSPQTFRTLAAVPVASSETPLEIATQEARLRARIDPEGQATTYYFEYGPTTAYGSSAPVPDGEAGSGHIAVSVSAHVAGLAPGTTYHYRVVATNTTGTTDGEDATFTTYPAQQQAGGCANEARREEQNSTYLPDCRAYEMVSPLDKNGTNIDGKGHTSETSPGGERVTYDADAGFGETNGSGIGGYTQYVAQREAGGWVSHGITPTPPQEAFQFISGSVVFRAYSEDLRYGIVEAYALPGVPGAVPKGVNDYRMVTADGSLETVTTPLTASVGAGTMTTALRGVSSGDAGVATFETPANLLPQATGTSEKLYAWNHGELTLAGILPDGSAPAAGSSAAHGTSFNGPMTDADTLSRDGSRIAFLSPGAGGEPQLYLRRDGTSTAWVDESEATTPVAEPKEVAFQGMSRDGHKLLFTTSSKLLDSDPGGAPLGLYMYTDGPSPASESNLTFIARVDPASGPAETVKETVNAISEDGSRVYFYTQSVPGLSEGGTYLWDNGTIHFVAATQTTLSQSSEGSERFVEASADGRELAFDTPEQLTTAPVGSNLGAMYLYDEESETLRCVSCLSTGMTTTSGVEMIPRATPDAFEEVGAIGEPRFISSDGRFVFFATTAALVSRDINGVTDVYEYDSHTGSVSLLSSGTGESGTWFSTSSSSGGDVFAVTKQSLVASDTDPLDDLYDIRIDGGFPQPKPQTGGCVGDECQGTPSAAPSFNTASGFSGLGNTAAKTSGESKPKTLTRAPKLTRAQRLKQALKVCRRKPKRARKRCEAQARKRYGVKKSGKSTSNRARR